MNSSMCSSAPNPKMWIIQGTLAWHASLVQTGFEIKPLLRRIDWAILVRFNIDPTFYSLNPYIPCQCRDNYFLSIGLSLASMGK
ncbi:hypothetical protein BT93_H0223 [Corymbia citriodora subsp. variegata]|nr:hypothetical protein BT93_H0223 [Corymbia citriodora subsp. variegata]